MDIKGGQPPFFITLTCQLRSRIILFAFFIFSIDPLTAPTECASLRKSKDKAHICFYDWNGRRLAGSYHFCYRSDDILRPGRLYPVNNLNMNIRIDNH